MARVASDPVGGTDFDTPIGTCTITWGTHGIVGIQLPDTARDAAACDDEPPAEVLAAVDGIRALLRGEACDLSAVPLDMSGVPPFHQRVYEAARTIPAGETATYGELAAEAGSPGAARAVGQALGRNPFAIVVPCHRITAANGKIGGFSADGGVATKARLLELEGTALSSW
ncbi:MAG: methylated-DNA--[protein]-cysteine S-methyltransferase [Acidimicrobiia bacterium]